MSKSLEQEIEQIITNSCWDMSIINAQDATKAILNLIDTHCQKREIEARINEIELLQNDIVTKDKYRSGVDQQAWAYARVHKLATDRIAQLKQTSIKDGEE